MMRGRRAGAPYLFFILAVVLSTCFIASSDAEVPEKDVANSTRRGLVMHWSCFGRRCSMGVSGARGGRGSSMGGSSHGGRGSNMGGYSNGGSFGKTAGGASVLGAGTAVTGARSGSHKNKNSSGGSRSGWNSYFLISAAATVVGIACTLA